MFRGGIAIALSCLIALSSCSKKKENLKHLSQLDIGADVTDVWGYVDGNGKEFAIVGFGSFVSGANITSGFALVDVSDPANPVLVSRFTQDTPGFDVKAWQNYVYTVDGNARGQGSIVDISDPAKPVRVGSFPTSHNIFIDRNGLLFTSNCGGISGCSNPTRIYDLNRDPTAPALLWEGLPGGHDVTVLGNRWYNFGASEDTRIFDISDPSSPQLISAVSDTSIHYYHSGWPTEDGNFLFICDELADFKPPVPYDFTVWDISDLSNPQKVGGFSDSGAAVHNLYVIGDFAYVSYYTAGLRVFDISNPAKPRIAAEFDTFPSSQQSLFDGAFGVYPFAPSGNIYVSDANTGLHIFSFKPGGLGGSNPLSP